MRFFCSLTFAGLAVTSVMAQVPFFGAPQNLTQVVPGENVLISVFQGDTNSQFEDVGIALGISQCFNNACPGTETGLGDVFYNGPFVPTFVGTNRYQNYTVTIPSFLEAGDLAQVTASLFVLTGAAAFPTLETIYIALEVV
ncbi:hypothetical protein BT96DRAFT_972014 [Gymnopus androsaceus JB14]|uniref:Uncharacterized protein n=1 Tax=Gymnopus androsaceus JB14 TaxID=1447944 RepID=A0A6A4IBW0_9AGAR|nr:hypothetical protein BT96DRAFT_972014 [Gymnopus androsaceus JB14]